MFEDAVDFSGPVEDAIAAEVTLHPVKESEYIWDLLNCIPIPQEVLDSAQCRDVKQSPI